LSCKSKSPTDATGASNDALATQSANNTTQTTTSSSTTTTVRPGQSPTNTTTLITSRTLTTTSTSTSTTSTTTTSIPITTTLKPTTTIGLTTTIATELCDIRWPRKPYNAGGYVLINGNRYYHNATYHAAAGEQITIKVKICNYSLLDYNYDSHIYIYYDDTARNPLYDYYESITPFPPGGSSSCKTVRTPAPFQLTDNGQLTILFGGLNQPMMPERACISSIIINIQID